MRTQEQIIADCEKRFDDMLVEADRLANDPMIQRPCKTCRWQRGQFCEEPLVKGFEERVCNFDREARWSVFVCGVVALCGPEKALWQPKLTLRERIAQFFANLERTDDGEA